MRSKRPGFGEWGPGQSSRGFTVMELLIAMALLVVLTLVSGVAFSTTFSAWAGGRKLADEQQNARLVLEWMGRRVRLAGVGAWSPASFIEADSGSMAFFADVNGDGTAEVHRFCLDGPAGVVREQIVALPPAPSTCTSGSPITSRGIRPLRVVWLGLAYFAGLNGGIEPALPIPVPPTGNNGLPAVKRVQVTLGLDSNQSGAFEAGVDVTFRMNAVVRNY